MIFAQHPWRLLKEMSTEMELFLAPLSVIQDLSIVRTLNRPCVTFQQPRKEDKCQNSTDRQYEASR